MLATVTPRELEVLAWITRGHSNLEIAGRRPPVSTRRRHIAHILGERDVCDRVRAVVFADETGFVLACAAR